MCGLVFFEGLSLRKDQLLDVVSKIHHRGPDDTRVGKVDGHSYGFNRLAIMDLSENANQPFEDEDGMLLCNGEIYNFLSEKRKHRDFTFQSHSDCEVLLPLYQKGGIKNIVDKIDGEYAFVLYDKKRKHLVAGRDPMGIRPLFYGFTESKTICFSSEAKALKEFCSEIKPFPPGHYYEGGKFVSFKDLSISPEYTYAPLNEITKNIREKLICSVEKRLKSDAPIGFLLSGGLDSSLVCAIAQKTLKRPIKTFAIGMKKDAIDLKYAKIVADHIGADHTEVIIDQLDIIQALRDVIWHLESWDITTVRASIGMYLVCKEVRKKDLRVLLTGEVSDELFGYKYTDFAPSPDEFQKEASKRVKELYMYDVLRADRCISANSLEARVPFADTEFVEYVMSIDPQVKMNSYGIGKYLLRDAFKEGNYLPKAILYREKAAFSDAVGHTLVDYLKQYAQTLYTDSEYKLALRKYTTCRPFSKESLLYREIFEEFYPGRSSLIKDYWMPNNTWKNCDVLDPSARFLPNYGASGN